MARRRRSLNQGGSGNGRNHCTTQQLVPVLLVSLFSVLYYYYYYYNNNNNSTSFSSPTLETETPSTETHMAANSSTTTSTEEEIFGVKIERNPPESKLTHLAVTSWPKWGCSPSKFPWTFTAKETMYLLEGKVKVYCDGYNGSFEIGAGDLVEFPKGMKVTWDVTEAVNKHYSLDDN